MNYVKNKVLSPRMRLSIVVSLMITIISLLTIFMPAFVLATIETNYFPTGVDPDRTPEVGDPISAGGGEFRQYWPLLNLGGLLPVGFTLIYAPDLKTKYPTNDGRQLFPPTYITAFDSNNFIRIVETEDRTVSPADVYINVLIGDDLLVFKDDGTGTFEPVGPDKYQIQKIDDYYYLMDPIRERVYIFRSRELGWDRTDQYFRRAGEAIYVMDRNNNTLSYSYNDDNLPTQISNGLGRSLAFTYVDSTEISERHLLSVADSNGRVVTFNYQELTCMGYKSERLVSFTDAMSQTTSFDYYDPNYTNCDLIKKINLPLGNSHIDQIWTQQDPDDGSNAIDSQKDAYGNELNLTLSRDADGDHTTVDNPDDTQHGFVHKQKRYPLNITDETGKQSTIANNSDDQITSITDRIGDTTTMTYHALSGKLASTINAKGDTLSHTYTAQSQTFTNPDNAATVDFTFYNVTRTDYPDGTNEQSTYDAGGNVLTRVDRAGKTWTYTYNSRGQVLTATNPTGGVTTYTYNTDATLASSTDSDIGSTTYGYDVYKRLNKITHPDGKFIRMAYDLNDRVTSITDENNHKYTYTYDANGNLTQVVDPASNNRQYVYDLMDRVNQVTDRLGKVSALAYDSMGRIASATDPNSIQTSLGYDSRGWLTGTTIGSRTWQTGYDDERVVSSRTTPLGYSTAFQTDKLGHTTGITNSLSQTTTFTRDSMGRITGITDPLSRTTSYSYDVRGLVSGVTLPVAGTASYTRNDMGLLTGITDLKGSNWTLGYTNMGRLQSSADPLGNTLQHTYDTRGRLGQTTYPDVTTLTRTYDDAGNITRSLYSGGLGLQYTYDGLDRLLTANGIAFTRDVKGRVTATDNPGTVFGATYDDGGRLATATYNNGAFTVTYTYESPTGLLSRVTDNLTNTQIDFSYDNDMRCTGITRSNGVNATLTYDNAGRLTRIQEGSIIDILYTLDAAGQVTRADMTVPLDPASLLVSKTNTFTHDAASQVSSNGYTYDSSGRQTAAAGNTTYTWDNASRLTGIDGITLAYNGLSDLTSRTQGSAANHYYYNYAIGLKPIAAEMDEGTKQFLRYYVWTPDGRLLYMIDSANGNKAYFYHFNRTGSTLALTDSTGTVVDSYAYTPYGQLLRHIGSSEQPFTFVGKWGVRQEGAGSSLYHMRARYYDADTAQFISREPIWPEIGNPRQLNPYQYAVNEPIGTIDITGRAPLLPYQKVLSDDISFSARFLHHRLIQMIEDVGIQTDPFMEQEKIRYLWEPQAQTGTSMGQRGTIIKLYHLLFGDMDSMSQTRRNWLRQHQNGIPAYDKYTVTLNLVGQLPNNLRLSVSGRINFDDFADEGNMQADTFPGMPFYLGARLDFREPKK